MARSVAALLLVVCVATLTAPTAALAQGPGSIVYIYEGNVWLASPDGTTRRQVTADGTVDEPYRDPTQSDAGAILALRGHASMYRLGRDGRSLAAPVRLAALDNGTEGLAVSPGGSLVAYVTTGTGTTIDPRWGTPTGIYLYGGTDMADLRGTPVEGGIGPNLLYPEWAAERSAGRGRRERPLHVRDRRCRGHAVAELQGRMRHRFRLSGGSGGVRVPQRARAQSRWPAPGLQLRSFLRRRGSPHRDAHGPTAGPSDDRVSDPGPGAPRSIPPTFAPDGSALAFDDVVFDPATFETSAGLGIRVMEIDTGASDCGLSRAEL